MLEVGKEFLVPLSSTSSSDKTLSVLNGSSDSNVEMTSADGVIGSGASLQCFTQTTDIGPTISVPDSSDITLAGLDDMPEHLTVTDHHLEQQLKVDGVLSSNSTILLPDNLVLFDTSKGLILSVGNQDGLNYTASFVTTSSDSHSQTLSTSSLPGTIFPQIQLVGDDSGSGVYEASSDGTVMVPVSIFQNTHTLVTMGNEADEQPKKKGCGGWPKGKKRKNGPVVNTPRKPMTGYVIFAVKRRQELKVSNPEMTFPEVTKLMGQEWSNMEENEKERYMKLAEEDKERYVLEMKEFQHSDQYQTYLKNKRQSGDPLNGVGDGDIPAIDIEGNDGDELYCRLCNQVFISAHNKREHMFGRQHLQNISSEIRRDMEEQEAQKAQQLYLTTGLDQYGETVAVSMVTEGDFNQDSSSLDISDFIQHFMEKNRSRDREIRLLEKAQESYTNEKLIMDKHFKELQVKVE
ncbi:high mobility group protein 20A-like isoform X2 [Dreissena polymorpha]|uniref:high mobility group protein 20A-like isoform X2 n=1 Tax=Dreissena polymorpha TaxID=45954 RepID=UPI00226487E5|nr:high mobility group protein 20A-like isoform X2 [Dreissena polymorpha]